MRINPFRRQDEQGSIAIFMVVVLVTTGLVMITAATVESGMRSSRRGGDSANALQVADAGINDAVTAIQEAGAASFTRTGVVGDGSYTYTATQDPANPDNWLIDVYGVDKTGVKRHVRATASGEPLFASPMYINTSFSSSAGGILDSYTSGVSLAGPSGLYTDGGCTDKGYMFFNPGATVSFQSSAGGGSGTSVNNCNQLRFSSWNFSMDGCVVYGGVLSPPLNSNHYGAGKCPSPTDASFPGRTKAVPEIFSPPKVLAPAKTTDVQSPTQSACGVATGCAPTIGGTFTCSSSTGTNSLKAGWTYYYDVVNLKSGCGIDTSTITTATPAWIAANPVEIYANSVNLDPGTQGLVNPPPVTAHPTICGSSGVSTWNYEDINNNPAWYYCSGWVRSLSINLIDGSNPTINIGGNKNSTKGKFWGTFTAPKASVTLDSSNMEFFGAMIAGNLQVKNQFSWHYDDSLSQRTSGKYAIKNWREEPL